MTYDKKQAFKESTIDTGLALLINFPLNILLLNIAYWGELTIFETSVFLTIVFTTFAIVRKTYTRLYFDKRNQRKTVKNT
jgi:hypothetical protein|tara:strand:- start:1991 stop:2230 length:240 start_codon:yes stop_codon:yes gene_type:complete